ncbi:MAG: TIGR04551 family protein [Myxococcaceae bacterium]
MAKVLLAALLVTTATAFAQAPPAAAPAASDDVRREVDAKVENAKKEMREEIRAQLATQSAAQGWQEGWVEEKRKLELLTLDGYFRVRPDLFHKFDLGRYNTPDPSGNYLWPVSPVAPGERTNAGVNMRFRAEPTINISEEVRIRAQVDALDNVVWGSSPEYAFTRGYREQYSLFYENQAPPRSAINAVSDSIAVKRVYGEVSTPVGILRFGRMGSHWGLGMQNNDGNCQNCDFGDTVDRVMFVTEPFSGFYVTPMIDFNVEGPISQRTNEQHQPFDLSNSDDAHSLILAIARRDTDQQAKAKLENNQSVFNYGLRFTYRFQKNDSTYFNNTPFVNAGGDRTDLANGSVQRGGALYVPNAWLKFERKDFRIELEGQVVLGKLNRALSTADQDAGANQAINIFQYGGVLQAEYKLMNNALRIGLEYGIASGDTAPGFGARPGVTVRRDPDGNPLAGQIEGPQYVCSAAGCSDNTLNNFRFNRDYRVDLILFREIIGTITDAMYLKPTVSYEIADGFKAFGAVIGSKSIYAASTPSVTESLLGVELNVGAQYETEDGFMASFTWAVLFPMAGLRDAVNPAVPLETAQALRGMVGMKF